MSIRKKKLSSGLWALYAGSQLIALAEKGTEYNANEWAIHFYYADRTHKLEWLSAARDTLRDAIAYCAAAYRASGGPL